MFSLYVSNFLFYVLHEATCKGNNLEIDTRAQVCKHPKRNKKKKHHCCPKTNNYEANVDGLKCTTCLIT